MLTSMALIFLCGLLLGSIFNKLRLPSLMGMIITGIILSPYALNLLDDSILAISPDLRQMALVIILTRAGLNLDLSDIKKVGRAGILMCFVPALFEITASFLFAPVIFHITRVEALILGSVLAAVSPAVIVPRMLKIMQEGYGNKKSIPQILLAGASVDDIFVIVLFTSFTSLALGGKISPTSFLQIPVSIVMGVVTGIICGFLLVHFFKKFHMRDSTKIVIVLSISFLLIELENILKGTLPLSALLGIMTLGIIMNTKYNVLSKRLSSKYNKLWVAAEILLFVLVGATVDLSYALREGAGAIIFLFICLIFRMAGVFVCLIKTSLNKKERIFCSLAYIPKATVQAAIGAIPLSMGLACGQLVLTVAVLSILITAPLGATLVDNLYKKMLAKE